MHPARVAVPPLPLSPDERAKLEQWAAGRDRRLARRASLVLGFADGEEPKTLARRFRLSEPTAVKWRTRFDANRLAGLVDAARSGAPRRILAEDVDRVISRLHEPPPAGQSRWTTRTLARACGVSQTTVSRIWRAHSIDPRAGVFPPVGTAGNGAAARSQLEASAGQDERAARDLELMRLAREVGELRISASAEQVPFLRIAVEALDAALSSANLQRIRAAREGSRLARTGMQAAIVQARSLVSEARARMADLKAQGHVLEHPRSGDREPDD
jgi:transposase